MSTTKKPTDTDLAKISDIFQEIASMASNLDQAVISSLHDGTTDVLTCSIGGAIQKIGWMADLGNGLVDGTGRGTVKSDAESWFLPPFYNAKREVKS